MKYVSYLVCFLAMGYSQVLFWPYSTSHSPSLESFEYAIPAIYNVDSLIIGFSVAATSASSEVSFSLLSQTLPPNKTLTDHVGSYRVSIPLSVASISGKLILNMSGDVILHDNRYSPTISFVSSNKSTVTGGRGSIWHVGAEPPLSALEGDFFFNSETFDVSYFSDTWKVISNLKGNQGDSASLADSYDDVLGDFASHPNDVALHDVSGLNTSLQTFKDHVDDKDLHFSDSLTFARSNQYASPIQDGLVSSADFQTFDSRSIVRWNMNNGVLTSSLPSVFSTQFSADTVFHNGILYTGLFNDYTSSLVLQEPDCIDGTIYSIISEPVLTPIYSQRVTTDMNRFPLFDPVAGDTARSYLGNGSPLINTAFWDANSGGLFPGGAYEVVCINSSWWIFR